MTVDELVAFLDAQQPSQRQKLAALRDEVAAIRAYTDAAYLTAIRTIKKTIKSPKLADDVAELLAELGRDRMVLPVAAVEATPAAVRWVPTDASDVQLSELEPLIAADPEAQETYVVLGDTWSSRGDVRGELIAIGHALAKNKTHKAMRARWTQLFDAHAAAIWGELLAPYAHRVVLDADWYMGFLRGCRVMAVHGMPSVPDVLHALLDDPGPARFLQSLIVAADDNAAVVTALARRPRPTLRTLAFGEPWLVADDLAPLWPVLEHLRDLAVAGFTPRFAGIALPRLARLAYDYGPGDEVPHAIDVVEPILASRALPALRVLEIHNCECADELARMLVGSPLLPQLQRVRLGGGTLTAIGGEVLLRARDQLAHLQLLDLELNYLPDELCAQLGELGPHIHVGDQRPDDDVVDRGRHSAAYE